jgi:hypothetical protein
MCPDDQINGCLILTSSIPAPIVDISAVHIRRHQCLPGAVAVIVLMICHEGKISGN